jgi:WD40 repeat protein
MLEYVEVRHPYPGLRPFEPYEASIFFGRDAQIDRLLEILRAPLSTEKGGPGKERRFLAVIGPSGCGKSSLVRAGLLPAIAAGWLGTGSDWRILTMRPGNRPIHELACMLSAGHVFGKELGATDTVGLIEGELTRGRRGLFDVFNLAARRVEDPQRLNLLVLIDQFEELFTHTESADEASDFVNLLLAAAAEHDARIHVVITMRTDFLGDCADFLDLPDAVNRGMFLTPRLNRDEMRMAIIGPAASFGGSIDEQLVGELINGVGGKSDELPILQHALARMWEYAEKTRKSTAIVSSDLNNEEVGGLGHALSSHADRVYESLPSELKPLTKKLFQFITKRTSPENGSKDVKRVCSLKDIAAAIGCDWSVLVPIIKVPVPLIPVEPAEAPLPAFGDDGVNFIFVHGKELHAGSLIEISHEALIRKWERLKEWVQEEAGRADGYRRWKGRALSRSARLTKTELSQAVSWRDGKVSERPGRSDPPDAKWAVRYGSASDFEKTVAYITSSKKKAMLSKLAGVVAVILIFGTVVYVGLQRRQTLMAAAEVKRMRAEREQQIRLQESEKRAGAAEAELTKRQLQDAQEAIERAQRENELEKKSALENLKLATAQTEARAEKEQKRKAIAAKLLSESQLALANDPELAQLLAIEAYKKDPSDENESFLRALRVRFASLRHTLRGAGRIRRVAFSPNGKTVLTIGSDGTRLWDVVTGRSLLPPPGYVRSAIDAVYNADGSAFLTFGVDRAVRVWDVATGGLVTTLSQPSYIYRAAFAPKGNNLAVATADRVSVWDVKTQKQSLLSLAANKSLMSDVAYSPDGQKIAAVSTDKTVRVWDANDTQKPAVMLTPSDNVRRIVFNSNGTRLLTLNNDKTAQIWDTATGAQVGVPLTGHTGTLYQAAFSPDGKIIVTAGADGTARSWNAATGKQREQRDRGFIENSSRIAVMDVSFRPSDNDTVLVASEDGTVRLFNLQSDDEIVTFDAHHPVANAAFSPDGNSIVTAHDDAARLWDTNAARAVMTLSGTESSDIEAAVFINEGKNIVTATKDETTQEWDIPSDSVRLRHRGETSSEIILLSPDGGRMLSFRGEKKILLLDALTGRVVATFELPVEPNIVAFSGGGKRLLIGLQRTAEVWDAISGKLVARLEGHDDEIEFGAFSPDEKVVLTTGKDGTSRLWNTARAGRQIRMLDSPAARPLPIATGSREVRSIVTAAFSQDGNVVATADEEGKVRFWERQSGHLIGTLPSHSRVRQIIFSPDGNSVVTIGMDENARLWNVHTGQPVAVLKGHRVAVLDAVFSRNGKLLATAGMEGTVRLWDAATGRLLALLEGHRGLVHSLSFSPEGKYLLSLGSDGTARLWDVSPGRQPIQEVIADIQHRVARELTKDEIEEMMPASEPVRNSSQ